MTEAIEFTTFEEFLAAEIDNPTRHELVAGRVYAMAGGTERHDLVAQALYERLVAGARAGGCRTLIGNRLVKVSTAESYHPDLMVVCGPRADDHYETSPGLIVEVVSPSTESIDRREKAAMYRTIPTLDMYLLVNPVFRRIEQATRDESGAWKWRPFGSGDVLFSPFGNIVIDELYDGVDAESSND